MKIIWDDDVATPPATPKPSPTPAPAATTINLRAAVTQLALVALVGFNIYQFVARPGPTPTPAVVDVKAIGKAYPAELGRAYAAAWEEGARQLDAGATIPDALAATAKRWDTDRTSLFAAKVSPAFARLVPEGADPKSITPGMRSDLAKAWRDFGAGLAGR